MKKRSTKKSPVVVETPVLAIAAPVDNVAVEAQAPLATPEIEIEPPTDEEVDAIIASRPGTLAIVDNTVVVTNNEPTSAEIAAVLATIDPSAEVAATFGPVDHSSQLGSWISEDAGQDKLVFNQKSATAGAVAG